MNRRNFLKRLAAGSLAVTAYGPVSQLAQGAGTPRPRRHLIQIMKGGGIDTWWHHNSMAPSQIRSSAHPAEEQGTQTPGSPSSRNIQRIGSGSNDYLTIREPENQSQFYTASGRTHYFGSSFQQLFRDTRFQDGNPLLSKMQIWKGMGSDCRHDLDNPILAHGIGSSYAISFSALIAERLAKDSARTLHYAVLHNNPSEAFLNFALNTGYQSPSCIPGITGLQNLTGTDPNDFGSSTRRQLVATAVKNLSSEMFKSRFKLRSSVMSLDLFKNSFNASQKVTGSHLDQDVELLYARARFRYRIFTESARFFGVHNSSGLYHAMVPLAGQSGMASGQWYIDKLRAGMAYADANPLPDMTTYRTKKLLGQDVTTDVATLRTQLNANINNPAFHDLHTNLIDQFAMAAYLVRENLSAVVDFRDGYGMGVVSDAHGNVVPGLAMDMVFMAGFQELMRYLDEYKEANPGETLLDATHIVMHTEMDRTAWIGGNSIVAGNGTNHAERSTSVIMAGYGVHGGRIIGDNHKGPNDANQFQGLGFTHPLPIDVGTGLPNANGKLVTIKSLAPTMLAMFDAPLPFNQISDEDAVPAVIKKKMG